MSNVLDAQKSNVREGGPSFSLKHRLFRAVPLEVSGTLGVAFYRVADDGSEARFFALHVLETRGGRISAIDHFMSKTGLAALFADGLAATIPA